MNKVLTISVAAYNAAAYIEKCLDSFTGLSVLDALDIIVVDDGSTDHTAQLVKQYCARYPGSIRLIQKENGGHGSTINASIPQAVGKYYKLVDSDDWVDAEGMQQLVGFLEKSDADLVVSDYSQWLEESKKLVPVITTPQACVYEKTLPYTDYAESIKIYLAGSTIKTELLQKNKIRVSEHCFYVDTEFVFYLMPIIHTVAFTEKSVYVYWIGRAGQSVAVEGCYRHLDDLEQVCKNVAAFTQAKRQDAAVEEAVKRAMLEKAADEAYHYFDLYMLFEDIRGLAPRRTAMQQFLKSNAPDVYAAMSRVNRGKRLSVYFNVCRLTNWCALPLFRLAHRVRKGNK
ncbi:MAG: glycosyltransferase family A protein [Gemmiger sp.]|nr:glycosyltransferase family A protein [Gemmiger sp.]